MLERPARWEVGKSNEERRSPRRRTLAAVRVLEGPELGGGLGGDRPFRRRRLPPHAAGRGPGRAAPAVAGDPHRPQPIVVTARAVRSSPEGIGLRFEEVSARDRARLRAHAGFYEMDEAIVRVQRALGDLIPGNLLPLGEPSEIRTLLAELVERGAAGHRHPARARLQAGDLPGGRLRDGRDRAAPCCGSTSPAAPRGRGALSRLLRSAARLRPGGHRARHGRRRRVAAFEVMVPERIYLTERRTERRSSLRRAFCELPAPHAAGRPAAAAGDGPRRGRRLGAPGAPPRRWCRAPHLPAFALEVEGERREVGGATVRYLSALDDGALRAGLRFDEGDLDRDSFRELKRHAVRGGLATRLSRTVSMLGGKLGGKVAAFVRRPGRQDEGRRRGGALQEPPRGHGGGDRGRQLRHLGSLGAGPTWRW